MFQHKIARKKLSISFNLRSNNILKFLEVWPTNKFKQRGAIELFCQKTIINFLLDRCPIFGRLKFNKQIWLILNDTPCITYLFLFSIQVFAYVLSCLLTKKLINMLCSIYKSWSERIFNFREIFPLVLCQNLVHFLYIGIIFPDKVQ